MEIVAEKKYTARVQKMSLIHQEPEEERLINTVHNCIQGNIHTRFIFAPFTLVVIGQI